MEKRENRNSYGEKLSSNFLEFFFLSFILLPASLFSITSFRSISSHKFLFLDAKWRIKTTIERGHVEPVDSSILRFWHFASQLLSFPKDACGEVDGATGNRENYDDLHSHRLLMLKHSEIES